MASHQRKAGSWVRSDASAVLSALRYQILQACMRSGSRMTPTNVMNVAPIKKARNSTTNRVVVAERERGLEPSRKR